MKRAALVVLAAIAACGGDGGGDSLSPDDAERAVEAAVRAAGAEPSEAGFDADNQLLVALEAWLPCGAGAVDVEVPDVLADASGLLGDGSAIVLAVAYDGDVDRAVRGTNEADGVECELEVVREGAGVLGTGVEVEIDVAETDGVGDVSTTLEGFIAAPPNVRLGVDFRMAAVGSVVVVVGDLETIDEVIDAALEAAVVAAEEAID